MADEPKPTTQWLGIPDRIWNAIFLAIATAVVSYFGDRSSSRNHEATVQNGVKADAIATELKAAVEEVKTTTAEAKAEIKAIPSKTAAAVALPVDAKAEPPGISDDQASFDEDGLRLNDKGKIPAWQLRPIRWGREQIKSRVAWRNPGGEWHWDEDEYGQPKWFGDYGGDYAEDVVCKSLRKNGYEAVAVREKHGSFELPGIE